MSVTTEMPDKTDAVKPPGSGIANEVTTAEKPDAPIRFTVSEFDRMIKGGVFEERDDERLELLYGEIIRVNPPNPPHVWFVDQLTYWSIDNTQRDQILVSIQNPVGIPELDSVPEPDVVWKKARDYRTRRPEPEDVLLVIEVAETSLGKDRHLKGPLYAKAGLQDYWIVNLRDSCIEIHRKPLNDSFQWHQTLGRGESVSPLAAPDVKLDVSSLFGG